MINFCQTLANPIVVQLIQAMHRVAHEVAVKKEAVTVFLCDPAKDFPDLAAIQFTQIEECVFTFQSNGELFTVTHKHRPSASRIIIEATVPVDPEALVTYPKRSKLAHKTEVLIKGKKPKIIAAGDYVIIPGLIHDFTYGVIFDLAGRNPPTCMIASKRRFFAKSLCLASLPECLSQYELSSHGMITIGEIRSGYDILLKAVSSLKTPR